MLKISVMTSAGWLAHVFSTQSGMLPDAAALFYFHSQKDLVETFIFPSEKLVNLKFKFVHYFSM